MRDADPARIGVIKGARLTNESQYAWTKLAKGVLGTDHVDAQLGDGLRPRRCWVCLADQACPGGTVILVGPDPGRPRGAVPACVTPSSTTAPH